MECVVEIQPNTGLEMREVASTGKFAADWRNATNPTRPGLSAGAPRCRGWELPWEPRSVLTSPGDRCRRGTFTVTLRSGVYGPGSETDQTRLPVQLLLLPDVVRTCSRFCPGNGQWFDTCYCSFRSAGRGSL